MHRSSSSLANVLFDHDRTPKESTPEASDNSSPSTQSPVLKPTNVPTNGNTAPSPALDAVSSTSYTTNTTRSTNDWMRGVPGLGSSPGGNLINLMGESPPTLPSSYEDNPRSAPYGWSSPRPYYNGQVPSSSPPVQSRRPLSLHMDSHFLPSDAYAPSAASLRRSSVHSQTAYARGVPNPPLPHQPQAHFYGAPEVDLEFEPKTGIRPGERGYAYGFDTLPRLHGPTARGKDTVVLTGYEGGLEVHSITRSGLDTIASLKGLRGGVHHAKILPWTLNIQGSDPSPLVAVIVHGPVLPSGAPEVRLDGNLGSAGPERSGAASPIATDLGQKDNNGLRTAPVEFYQTTVDVYSLQDSRHIAVLLEGPKIPLKTPITSPIFQPPPPTGALRILADHGTMVIASGQTGESWIYRQASIPQEPGVEFRCCGKLWTSLQQPLVDPSQETNRSRASAQRQAARAPIVALRGRWVAYCPAAPSSQMSLRAAVPVPIQGKAPGLASLTPPQLPSVISDVDLPAEDSIMNKLMRETTQEVISGAKWIGERGLQAFNSYWNKPATPSQQARSPPSAQAWNAPQFPPTHGTVAPAITKEPGLVSIVDVETSLSSSSIHPVTTFATPGCSYLSFSPNGLSLFTASTKGDVQTIWDLMRIQHTKSSPLQSASLPSLSSGPRVRQIAQFSRLTVARIVDVSWMKPNGECVAMVTERGTVHLLDLPPSALTWPPPRRRLHAEEAMANTSEGNASAVSIATGALNSAWDAARPLINRSRRSSSIANAHGPQSTGSKFVEHANYSGKMIAAGISHSLGKTGSAINQLRHSGDNRIPLPSNSNAPGSSCVILVANRRDHSLFVLGDGFVRTFPQRPRKTSTAGERQSATRFRRYTDFKLPLLPDDTIAPLVKRSIDPDEYLDLLDKDGDGVNNTMVLTARPKLAHRNASAESSIPQAEIESSAPYQPFHTDKRVALYEVSVASIALPHAPQPPTVSVLLAEGPSDDRPSRGMNKRKQKATPAAGEQEPQTEASSAWAFGQPIPMLRVDNNFHLSGEDEVAFAMSTDDVRALPQSAMERSVARHRDDGDEQIVVTTRRRRGGGRNGDIDEDGFFEDDCEVLDFADQRV